MSRFRPRASFEPLEQRALLSAVDLLPPHVYLHIGRTTRAGTRIELSTDIQSQSGDVPTPVAVKYILSTDAKAGNADDIPIGSNRIFAHGPTPPGTIVDYYEPPPLTVTLPAKLGNKHYFLFAVADPRHQIAESNESNNVSPPYYIEIPPTPGSASRAASRTTPPTTTAHPFAATQKKSSHRTISSLLFSNSNIT